MKKEIFFDTMKNCFLIANDEGLILRIIPENVQESGTLSDQYIPIYGLNTPISGLLPVYFCTQSINENVFWCLYC